MTIFRVDLLSWSYTWGSITLACVRIDSIASRAWCYLRTIALASRLVLAPRASLNWANGVDLGTLQFLNLVTMKIMIVNLNFRFTCTGGYVVVLIVRTGCDRRSTVFSSVEDKLTKTEFILWSCVTLTSVGIYSIITWCYSGTVTITCCLVLSPCTLLRYTVCIRLLWIISH